MTLASKHEFSGNIECLDSMLAVLVLFNTPLDDSSTFKSLSNALKIASGKMDLLIYDNSPVVSVINEVPVEGNWNISYMHDPYNPGVSKAYNEGFKLAGKLGKKWMLLLDQDTNFPEHTIQCYCNAINCESDICVIAPVLEINGLILSPFREFYGWGRSLKKITNGINKLTRLNVVNSGLMISLDAFEKAGGYNESIKVDYSDISFLNRLKKHFSEIFVLSIRCEHGFFNALENDKDQLVERFGIYCRGAKMMYKETGNCLYLLVAFARTLKLVFKRRSFLYFKQFFTA